jgi:RNA-directed DNA polymerase
MERAAGLAHDDKPQTKLNKLDAVLKPETFKFLGFIHICGQSRRGKFLLKRRTRRDRMRTKLSEIKEELRRRVHQPIPEQGRWLAQVMRGFFAYHAVPTNFPALRARFH